MKKIIGVGNSLVDMMIRIPDESYLAEFKLAKGSMSLVDSKTSSTILERVKQFISQKAAGGSAANTINGLAKLGVPTAFIGKTGRDAIGDFFRADLKNNGVKDIMLESPTESGRVAALITPDSERTFATYLGASVELEAEDLKPELFKNSDICYIEGYLVQNHKLIETVCECADENNCEICIDLASYNVVNDNKEFLKEIIENYVDIVFANEDEAKAITGCEPEKALEELSKLCRIAVVKTGAKGSLVKSGKKIARAGVIPVNLIDTTGAGDLYAAGFLFGYIQGMPLEKCAHIGSITAGRIVEVLGAKLPEDTWTKIKKEINAL